MPDRCQYKIRWTSGTDAQCEKVRTMRLPGWLNPWRTARNLRITVREQARIIDNQATAGAVLRARAEEAERAERSLRGQLAAAVTDAQVSGAALSTAEPEFVLVGIPRGTGKRLMASRNVAVTAFSITEPDQPPPRWKLGAVMERMLVIDKPDYGQALEHMAMIWRNWDRDAGAAQERISHRFPALPGGGDDARP